MGDARISISLHPCGSGYPVTAELPVYELSILTPEQMAANPTYSPSSNLDYSRARRRGVSTPSVLNVSSQKKSSREKILSPVFTEFCEHRLLGLSRRYVNSAIAKYRTVGSRWCPITNSCCRQIMSLGRLHPPLDGSPTCLDESFLSFWLAWPSPMRTYSCS